jgi:hypothetical protein
MISTTALHIVHVSALVHDDQRPLELAHVLGVDPEVGLQRDLDVDALRHVDERAAGPGRGVQRRELVVAGRDDRAVVLAEQLRLLLERGVGVEEEDALLLEVLADLVVHHLGLVLGGDPGDQALLLRLGDAQPVVGVLDVRWEVVPVLRLLLGGADEVLDVVEIDAGQVGTPVGHGLAAEVLQALEPHVEHPLGLVLAGRDVPYHVFGQSATGAGAGHVRVGPAELVRAQPVKLVVRGGCHVRSPPDSAVL